jgi:hypothetical protein
MTREHRDVVIDKAVKRARNAKEKNRDKGEERPGVGQGTHFELRYRWDAQSKSAVA